MASNSKADELERRLVQFAIDIVKVIGELPKNSEGNTLQVSICAQEPLQRQITAKRER